jgi:hypothetical protein
MRNTKTSSPSNDTGNTKLANAMLGLNKPTKRNLTRDELMTFIIDQSRKVKNFKFDLCHDIRKVMNYAYDFEGMRDENGELITDTPIYKEYVWQFRDSGTFLWDIENKEQINHVREHMGVIEEYKLRVTKNCDYLHNVPFAEITKIK